MPPFATTTARAGVREVGDEPLLRVQDLRADRDLKHGVVAALARGEAAAAAAAAAGAHLLIRPEAGQVAPRRVGDEHDVAAVAAVAAVRPALGDELLTAEVDGAVAAAAGDHGQLDAIVEHP